MARREGEIKARGPGRWLIRWSLGRDETGKYRSKSRTVRGTRRDAERELRRILRSRDTGEYVEPTKQTVGALLSKWLESAKPRLAPRTYRDYCRTFDAYVRPRIGDIRLSKLSALDIQAMYSELQQRGISKREHARGLGARSIRLIHAPLRQALEQAVKWGLVARNVATLVDLPRLRRSERRSLSPHEVSALLKAARGTRFDALWALLLDTGCRPGEALGLRWSDLDLNAATATIRGAVTLDETGKPYRSEHPKTARSRRTNILMDPTVESLRSHRARQAAEAMELGPAYDRDADLVFSSVIGTLVSESNLRRRHFIPLRKAAGLPNDITLYVLRHTCATLALKAGVPLLVIAERLGHTDGNLVLSTYGHTLPGQQAEATAALAEVIYGVSPTRS